MFAWVLEWEFTGVAWVLRYGFLILDGYMYGYRAEFRVRWCVGVAQLAKIVRAVVRGGCERVPECMVSRVGTAVPTYPVFIQAIIHVPVHRHAPGPHRPRPSRADRPPAAWCG